MPDVPSERQDRPVETARLTILADVDELLSAIAAVDVADGLVQLVEADINLTHFGPELVEIQADCDAAVRTGVLRVRFEPSDRLRDLVATFRAGDSQFGAVKHDPPLS